MSGTNKNERITAMKKFSIKLTSIILSVAIIMVSLPLTVFAITNKENEVNNIASETENTAVLGKTLPDIYELTDRRDEYTKHFRTEDGSVVAAQYNDPIHYLDENGSWQDINMEGVLVQVNPIGARLKKCLRVKNILLSRLNHICILERCLALMKGQLQE